jgi:hypothetical protein
MSGQELGPARAYARVLALFRRLLKQRWRPHYRRRPRSAIVVSNELRALALGQLTVDEYLEAKMTRALEPLQATLPDAEVAHVRACLREHVRTQPMWRRVVRQLKELLETRQD